MSSKTEKTEPSINILRLPTSIAGPVYNTVEELILRDTSDDGGPSIADLKRFGREAGRWLSQNASVAFIEGLQAGLRE